MATQKINVLDTVSRNASGAGSSFDVARHKDIVLHSTVVVTTPGTLDLILEDSIDGTNFAEVRRVTPQITAAGTYRIEVGNLVSLFARVRWEIGGSGVFVFGAKLATNPIA